MRIAHVANFYGPKSGGLRTAMHQIGAGYLARGHEFVMIVPGPADADEQTEFGRRVTVRAPVLPFSGGYRVIVRTGKVRAALRAFAPAAVEVSDRTTLRGLGAWARRQGWASTFFSHERADGVLRANVPRVLQPVVPIRALARAHNRGTHRRFTTVVCTTAYAAQEFDALGLETARVPLGVDLETFKPARRDKATRDKYRDDADVLIVMASRLSREKRPDLAIDAVRMLAAGGLSVRLVSAGSGAWADAIERRAAGAPVTFLGFLDGRDSYATLLASADVLVAPGPIETFGLAALEGLASGTPAVVNELSALPEVVGDAGAAAGSTPEGFANAIADALARPSKARRAAARRRAEEFPWSATVERLVALHESGG